MPERQDKHLTTIVGIYNPQRAKSMVQAAEELGLADLETAESGEDYTLLRRRWKRDKVISTVPEGCVFVQIRLLRKDVGSFREKVYQIAPLASSTSTSGPFGLLKRRPF